MTAPGGRGSLWLVLIALTVVAQAPPGLIGRWRSIQRSKGGIGAMYEFHDDGTYGFSPGAVMEMTYRIEGDQLILPPATTTGPEQRFKMAWRDADHLLLTAESASMTLSRQGAPRDTGSPILGEWTTPLEMEGRKMVARYLFEPAGKVLFLWPFLTETGRYSVKGSTIRIEFPKAAPVEGSFRIDGDVLTIPSPRGTGESRFRRY